MGSEMCIRDSLRFLRDARSQVVPDCHIAAWCRGTGQSALGARDVHALGRGLMLRRDVCNDLGDVRRHAALRLLRAEQRQHLIERRLLRALRLTQRILFTREPRELLLVRIRPPTFAAAGVADRAAAVVLELLSRRRSARVLGRDAMGRSRADSGREHKQSRQGSARSLFCRGPCKGVRPA